MHSISKWWRSIRPFMQFQSRRWSNAGCGSTPDRFVFDIKLHRVLSRHAAVAKQLSPKLRVMSAARDNEKVKLTAELESAALDEVSSLAEIFRGQGKLGALLLQLSPAFSPKKHSLSELDQIISKLSVVSSRDRISKSPLDCR